MTFEKNINLAMVGLVRMKTRAYERQKQRALRVIEKALSRGQDFYLSMSGGKDSVALLSILMQAGLHGNMWAHVSDASFPGTVETIRECERISGWPLTLYESPVSAFDVIGKQSTQKFGKTGFFFDSIARFATEGEYEVCFTGVRAAESKRRMKAFKVHGHTFFTTTPSPITRCDAIAHFKIEDVAAAIVESELPIHPIYFKRPISDRCIRLGYVTSLDLIEKDHVAFLKLNYPELYLKFCNAYPLAKNYV